MSSSWMNMRIAIQTPAGWRYLDEFAALGHKQRRLMAAVSREFNGIQIPRGALSRIAKAVGVHQESAWTQLRALRRKFGVQNNTQLAHVARQLARTRGRGSSNQVSMFATVPAACECRRATTLQTEALHPGAAAGPCALSRDL